MSASKNTQSGFSMIELLVAILILAVGMLGLAELQVTAMKINAQSSSSTAGRALAQRYVERILSWESDDARFVDGGTATLVTALPIEGAGSFNVEYLISQVTDDGTASGDVVNGVFRIKVDVTNTASRIGAFGRASKVATAYALKRAI